MKIRIGTIFAWICAVLVSAFTVFSAIMQMLPTTNPDAIAMTERLGITGMGMPLGITKLIIVALYLWPRTSTVGFVLMVGYYGGVLATNITHGFSAMEALPIYIVFLLLTISAYFRNPELLSRITGKPVPVKA